MTDRSERLAALASQFEEYLRGQTGVQVAPPPAGNRTELIHSFERLDLALEQLADLASVYGSDPRSDVEPLTTPTAVLAGEYLRSGLGANWLEPSWEGDTSLMIVTPDGVALDLEGLARSTLMSSAPDLTSFVSQLLADDAGEE